LYNTLYLTNSLLLRKHLDTSGIFKIYLTKNHLFLTSACLPPPALCHTFSSFHIITFLKSGLKHFPPPPPPTNTRTPTASTVLDIMPHKSIWIKSKYTPCYHPFGSPVQ